MVGKPELTRSRDFVFRMRVLRAEMAAWAAAAKAAGQSTSAWARGVLNAAAGRANVLRDGAAEPFVVRNADVEALVDELERRGLVARARPRDPKPPAVIVSDLDRELARKLARRAGLHVTDPKGRRDE